MDTYGLVLRLLHIAGGVLWAGWAWSLALFVGPGVAAAGPEGGKVMQTIAAKTKLVRTMVIAPLVVVATGLLLYWRVSGGLTGGWMSSAGGVTITIGAVAGIAAWAVGFFVIAPAANHMAGLAAQGPPGPEVVALRDKINRYGRYTAELLGVTVVAMAIAATL